MEEQALEDFEIVMRLRCNALLGTDSELSRWIRNSLLSRNYYIFRNIFNEPNGYIIWAEVAKETIQRLCRTGSMPLYPYEWHEGSITLLLSLAFVDGLTTHNRSQLAKVIRQKRVISYIRNEKCRIFIRRNDALHRLHVGPVGGPAAPEFGA